MNISLMSLCMLASASNEDDAASLLDEGLGWLLLMSLNMTCGSVTSTTGGGYRSLQRNGVAMVARHTLGRLADSLFAVCGEGDSSDVDDGGGGDWEEFNRELERACASCSSDEALVLLGGEGWLLLKNLQRKCKTRWQHASGIIAATGVSKSA